MMQLQSSQSSHNGNWREETFLMLPDMWIIINFIKSKCWQVAKQASGVATTLYSRSRLAALSSERINVCVIMRTIISVLHDCIHVALFQDEINYRMMVIYVRTKWIFADERHFGFVCRRKCLQLNRLLNEELHALHVKLVLFSFPGLNNNGRIKKSESGWRATKTRAELRNVLTLCK